MESEIQKIEMVAGASAFLKRSVVAFTIFLLSVAANLPGYAFPIKYHNIMLVLTVISLVAIITAVFLAIKNLVRFARKTVLKNWKTYLGAGLNCLILLAVLMNLVLMF
ncbi:MAG TPA: hypothetical protein VGE06_11195 [Flavisolibacter sp.]